jgi:hypothetical protein
VRVAHLTSVDPEVVDHDLDRPFLEAAFTRRGIELVACAWEDGSVDWDGFDLVLVRSPWNYVEHEAAMRRFLARFASSSRFHNPVGVIEWNLDKRYLRQLAALDVPVIPTTYVESRHGLEDALAALTATEVVVKPTVSAGSRLTGRFVTGDRRARDLAEAILDDGRSVMVQPYLTSVDTESEYAVIVIDGEIAHRARKAQILDVGGTFTGGEYRELLTPATPDADLDRVALHAASACRDLARQRGWLPDGEELLYARYDIARTDEGAAVLLEAELFEPALFLPVAPDTADVVAAAVERRLSSRR